MEDVINKLFQETTFVDFFDLKYIIRCLINQIGDGVTYKEIYETIPRNSDNELYYHRVKITLNKDDSNAEFVYEEGSRQSKINIKQLSKEEQKKLRMTNFFKMYEALMPIIETTPYLKELFDRITQKFNENYEHYSECISPIIQNFKADEKMISIVDEYFIKEYSLTNGDDYADMYNEILEKYKASHFKRALNINK